MKSTRRQFLVQSAKAGLAVLAGVLGGLGLANRPRPTYEVLEYEHPPMVFDDAKERQLYICDPFDGGWWLDGKRIENVSNA